MAIRDIIQGGKPVVIPSDSLLFASKPQYFDLDARVGGLSAYHEPRGRRQILPSVDTGAILSSGDSDPL